MSASISFLKWRQEFTVLEEHGYLLSPVIFLLCCLNFFQAGCPLIFEVLSILNNS